jgi:hypothetical protein
MAVGTCRRFDCCDRSLHRIQQVFQGPPTPRRFGQSFFLAHVENGHPLSAPDCLAGEKRIAGDQNPVGSGPDRHSDSARHHLVRMHPIEGIIDRQVPHLRGGQNS